MKHEQLYTEIFSPARLTVCVCVCVDLCSAVGGVRSVGVSTLKVRRSLGLEPAAQLLIVRNTKTHTSDITDHMMQETFFSALNITFNSRAGDVVDDGNNYNSVENKWTYKSTDRRK